MRSAEENVSIAIVETLWPSQILEDEGVWIGRSLGGWSSSTFDNREVVMDLYFARARGYCAAELGGENALPR